MLHHDGINVLFFSTGNYLAICTNLIVRTGSGRDGGPTNKKGNFFATSPSKDLAKLREERSTDRATFAVMNCPIVLFQSFRSEIFSLFGHKPTDKDDEYFSAERGRT